MSDRKHLFMMETGSEDDSVDLFMDGESGTWRLFISDPHRGNVDFSLDGLRLFVTKLQRVVEQLEHDPDNYNAEVRKAWNE